MKQYPTHNLVLEIHIRDNSKNGVVKKAQMSEGLISTIS